MRGNDVLALVFSNMHDDLVRELTGVRTMGSVPFGGRYRLIDFTLSNLVNSGITKVGVITKSNYQSLMDHLGSGKAWDLSRKRDGLFILPPFGRGNAIYRSRIEALDGVSAFIKNCKEEYVFLTDCDVIVNFDVRRLIDRHIESEADITIAYTEGKLPKYRKDTMALTMYGDNVTDISIDPETDGDCKFGVDMFVMRKSFLEQIIAEAVSHSYVSFVRDIIQARVKNNKITGYKISAYTGIVDSLSSYFKVSMDLLRSEVRADLFNPQSPVYTKVRDHMPAVYGLGSSAKNSLVADGCVIDGEVENSILFRGVKIGKGTKVKDSILIQNTEVGNNCMLSNVILDKNVIIREGRTLMGFETYPVFIGKDSVV